jgi:predicted Ser/Thr protein kinase
MSADLPDDDDDPWASVEWPNDDHIQKDGLLPPHLQREFDHLLAAHNARLAGEESPPERLTPDLEQLEAEIADMASRQTPYMFGRFEALASMRGGMGLVIKARDLQLERLVAIKLWMRSGPGAQEALQAEAKILARLKHPNVVTVHEPGVWKERVYFVMEWIEGVDGHDWMARPRSWREVRRVFMAAGTGLAAAHEAGIHHRDFKPSNILIGNDGRVVVADFGVADSLHASPERDESGTIAGTPAYMAPERLRGKRGDARSDQFSFCATMWRALYDERPFAGSSIEALIESIERGEIREPPGKDVPRWLSVVLGRGLAYTPDDRYRDMRALLAALCDEPPDGATKGDEDADDGVFVIDGRVLHKSGAGGQRERWPYVAIAVLSIMVTVMGFNLLMRSPTVEPPTAETVGAEPYDLILEAVADDDFEEVERLWDEHKRGLSDAQALEIAKACVDRAKELELIDQAKTKDALWIAGSIARTVERSGSTAEAQTAASQIASDAWALSKELDGDPD